MLFQFPANSGGIPNLAFYADVPTSISASSGVVSKWSTAKSDVAINDGLAHALVATLDTAGDATARIYMDNTVAGTTTAASTTHINRLNNGDRNNFGTAAASQNADIFNAIAATLGPAFVFSTQLTGNSLATLVDYLKRRGAVV